MEYAFLQLLNMSISAGYLVLAIVILRPLLGKAPKFIRCILWALVGVRLMLPVSFESILSLIPSVQTIPPEILYEKVPAIESGIHIINSSVNPFLAEHLAPAAGDSVNPLQVISMVAANIWVLGVAAMALYAFISYLRLWLRLREAVPLRDNIWVCDRIESPFLLGIFRPRIYLPSSLPDTDIPYVLAHENAHLHRRDHWWKPLGFALLSIYWFHPLMWVAYILLCRDIELACDEKVIHQQGEQVKKAYSEALINCSIPKKMISACPLAFGEDNVKKRVKSILNYKKPAFWLILVTVLVCVCVAVCFLSDPPENDPPATTSFYATVLEVRDGSLLVAPFASEPEAKTSDRFEIITDTTGVSVGEAIYITYDGRIEELYPARIPNVYDVAFVTTPDEAQAISALKKQYPEFFGLPTAKGLEVYVWSFAPLNYHCALQPARNEPLPWNEIMELRGISLSEMALILKSYDISATDITIVLTQHPLSSYAYVDEELSAHNAYIQWALGLAQGTEPTPPGMEHYYVSQPAFTSILFDVDKDGIAEECRLQYGPTPGTRILEVFTQEDGEIEYTCVFQTGMLINFMAGEDGQLYIAGIGEEPGALQRLFLVSIQNDEVILTENGKPIPSYSVYNMPILHLE